MSEGHSFIYNFQLFIFNAVPKSCTPAEYAKATGLEALFGALYLAGQTDRLNELFKKVIES